MRSYNSARFAVAIWVLTSLVLSCGQLLSEDDDDSSSDSFDERIPSDWNGAEDWQGSDWKVTQE